MRMPCPLDMLRRFTGLSRLGQTISYCQRVSHISVLNIPEWSEEYFFFEWERGAAEAKKAEGASEHELLTPSPPMWTGNEACFHCTSDSWTLRIVSSPDLNTLSNSCRCRFPAHGEVRRMYNIFRIIIIIIIIIVIISIIIITICSTCLARLFKCLPYASPAWRAYLSV